MLKKLIEPTGLCKWLQQKAILSLLILVVNLFSSCSSAQIIEGQLTCSIITNGKPDPLFTQPKGTVFIYDHYMLEKLVSVNQSQKVKLNDTSDDVGSEKPTVSISTIGYILTDLKKNICWQYDTAQVSPGLVKQFSAQEKYLGILFKGDPIVQLGGDPNAMKFVKDTVFAKRKYNIYEQSVVDGPANLLGQKLVTIRAFADQTVKKQYYHISKTMDDKYGGYIDSFDCIYEGGNVNRYERRFDKGLTPHEKASIEIYIRLAKTE